MKETYFAGWEVGKKVPKYEDREENVALPNDITLPLPEVKIFNQAESMLQNIFEYTFLKGDIDSIDVSLKVKGLSQSLRKHLRIDSFSHKAQMELVQDESGWIVTLTKGKQRILFEVISGERKVGGQMLEKSDVNLWESGQKYSKASLDLVSILRDLELKILVSTE